MRSEVAVEPMAYPKKYDFAGSSMRVALRIAAKQANELKAG